MPSSPRDHDTSDATSDAESEASSHEAYLEERGFGLITESL
jgi:hypothetical protein